MIEELKWVSEQKNACIYEWTQNLRLEAKRLFLQDGTHTSMMFSFNEENGLISINPVPPGIDHQQLNEAIINTVNEHHLYGVIFIGEAWVYFAKENDHTAFQLLDGEMNVSDLNAGDKKEALMIRMENSDGDCQLFLDEIIRGENSVGLGQGRIITSETRKWFKD